MELEQNLQAVFMEQEQNLHPVFMELEQNSSDYAKLFSWVDSDVEVPS